MGFAVEGFACPNDPRSWGLGGYMPLVGSPMANRSWGRDQTKRSPKEPLWGKRKIVPCLPCPNMGYWGPSWSRAWRRGTMVSAWWPGLFGSNVDSVPRRHGKEGAELFGQSPHFTFRSSTLPILMIASFGKWPKERGHGYKQLKWASSVRWLGSPLEVTTSAIPEDLRVEPLLLCAERSQMRWFGHLVRMPRPTGRRSLGRPRTCWRDYVCQMAWEHHRIPQKSWMKWLGRGKSGLPCSGCCPPTRPQISSRRWMDGIKNTFEKNPNT